jgi:hypothetical protein
MIIRIISLLLAVVLTYAEAAQWIGVNEDGLC